MKTVATIAVGFMALWISYIMRFFVYDDWQMYFSLVMIFIVPVASYYTFKVLMSRKKINNWAPFGNVDVEVLSGLFVVLSSMLFVITVIADSPAKAIVNLLSVICWTCIYISCSNYRTAKIDN